jgi:hypothetical protein
MSSASPLAYYTAEKDQTRLPPALTAVAITGIVLCALAIVGQMFAGTSRPSQVNPSQTSEFSIGFAFGRLVSIAFTVLMLVGCCGLLSLRPVARIMVIVAAYAWVILAIVSAVVLVYAHYMAAAMTTGRGTPTVWITFLPALLVAAQLGFAIWASLVVRRPPVAALFLPEQPLPISPLVRLAAILTLAYASLTALAMLVELAAVALSVQQFHYVRTLHALPIYGSDLAVIRFTDILLGLLLHIGFVTGCILILTGRAAGALVLAICCLVKLTFAITIWSASGDYPSTFNAYNVAPTTWAAIYSFLALLSTRITSLMTPALLLAIFTYRPRLPAPTAPPVTSSPSPVATPRPQVRRPPPPLPLENPPARPGRRA